MRIPVLFKSTHATAEREVLADSGATDNFINSQLLKRLRISYLPVPNPIKIWNVDGTLNQDGNITHYTDLQVKTGKETYILRFLITNLGRDEVILGYPWFTAFEPKIRWREATLEEEYQPVVITTINTHEPTIELAIRALETYGLDEEAWEQLVNEEEPYIAIRKTTTASELAQKAMDHTKKTFEQMVPTPYHRHKKVFSEEASHQFPPKQPWDHAIDLLPEAPKTLDCKVYPLALTEGSALTEFLNEQLQKGYIRPSKSPYASPFFFIKKKDGKLRPVQDYRKLNALTIKNRYPLPLIPEIIDKVQEARLFMKLDVRWGYNNIRIKEGDEWKAAFKTNQGLYEPSVMFFGLTNLPSTFQTMMDTIFRNLILTNEVIVYMDDILIATINDTFRHHEIVHQVLYRLEEHDLYLKPEKCSFETLEVEYLGVIIGYGKIRMDPVKTQGVQTWEAPTNLTETRGFVGFLNFYRRFIKGFSKLARPLHDLTKKGVAWKWTHVEQVAFEALKRAVAEEPVLLFPQLNQPFEMEVDASAIAIGAVLNQKGEDGRTHPVAYYSESFSAPERNYDVYDRELLAIVKALRQWRTYLLGSPHQIVIYTCYDPDTFHFFSSHDSFTLHVPSPMTHS